MSEVVAKRYASALFEVAREHETIDAVEKQLTQVNDVINQHDELKKVLQHPQVASKNKKALIRDIFQEDLKQEVLNLLMILVDRNRENIIPDLLEAYTVKANSERGIIDVTVTTASPLDEKEKELLAGKLSQALNKKMRIHTKIKPDLIGGILVRIGNRLYDGTIAGKLAGFQAEITK